MGRPWAPLQPGIFLALPPPPPAMVRKMSYLSSVHRLPKTLQNQQQRASLDCRLSSFPGSNIERSFREAVELIRSSSFQQTNVRPRVPPLATLGPTYETWSSSSQARRKRVRSSTPPQGSGESASVAIRTAGDEPPTRTRSLPVCLTLTFARPISLRTTRLGPEGTSNIASARCINSGRFTPMWSKVLLGSLC
ncbi:unnamed protein product [Cuscuta campestris]|uniref:Uncharacterized protein n=1 Tax=Cuscuta campestris TaxID=132261 RepID=A0A484LBZ7_9ASTE|nr:unnamed protein product [Cuscuta campestris]